MLRIIDSDPETTDCDELWYPTNRCNPVRSAAANAVLTRTGPRGLTEERHHMIADNLTRFQLAIRYRGSKRGLSCVTRC